MPLANANQAGKQALAKTHQAGKQPLASANQAGGQPLANPNQAGADVTCASAQAQLGQAMAPLIPITCPLIYAARSEARNATSSATSSARPARCIGTICLTTAGSNRPSAIPVSMIPGATELTVMPRDASSSAKDLPAACRADLAAE